MKTVYIVYKERVGDEIHELEVEEVFRSESLEEAEKFLSWKENLYGRIDKMQTTYNAPPPGKLWRKEEFAWDLEFVETVREN